MPNPDVRSNFDADTLWDVGLRNLTAAQVSDILIDVYQTLVVRVGKALTSRLKPDDLQALEQLVPSERGVSAWLRANYPNYKDIIDAENALIIRTLKDVSDGLEDRTALTTTKNPDESDQFDDRART